MSDLQLPNAPESWNKIHGAVSSNIIQFCKLHPLDGNIIHAKASHYEGKFIGRQTSTGEIYTGSELTAATGRDINGNDLFALNSNVLVTHGDRQVSVKITDRLAAWVYPKLNRALDLSPEAFRQLADLKTGIIEITAQQV